MASWLDSSTWLEALVDEEPPLVLEIVGSRRPSPRERALLEAP